MCGASPELDMYNAPGNSCSCSLTIRKSSCEKRGNGHAMSDSLHQRSGVLSLLYARLGAESSLGAIRDFSTARPR